MQPKMQRVFEPESAYVPLKMSASLQRFQNYREEILEVLRFSSFEEYYGIAPSPEDQIVINLISQEELEGNPTAFYDLREEFLEVLVRHGSIAA